MTSFAQDSIPRKCQARTQIKVHILCSLHEVRTSGNGKSLQYACLENSRQKSLADYSPKGGKG